MHEKFAQAILGGATSSPSTERLENWSKVASNRFTQEGIPLNATVEKIAQENDLNPHFIERLCEMANLVTHNAIIPKDPEKRASFAFPLADAKKVSSSLGPCPVGPKMISDYAGPPQGIPSDGPSMAEMFGVGEDHGGHQGGEIAPRQKLIIMIQKKAALRDRLHDGILKSAMLQETGEAAVCSQIKQAVIQGAELEEIHKVASEAGYGEITAEILPKYAQDLARTFLVPQDGVEKLAFEAPEELINRDVPVTVINGRNPLIASLKTLKEYKNNHYHVRDGLMGINQELEILQQKLKELE